MKEEKMNLYSVNEIFVSLQGEGAAAGEPCVFVRFSGCNLKCPWCDTDHSYSRKMNYLEIIKEISLVSSNRISRIIFTGGEPTIQEKLPELIYKVKKRFPEARLAIETNGTNPQVLRQICGMVFVTVSPKFNMLDDKIIESLEVADEIKIVLDEKATPEIYVPFAIGCFKTRTAFIQPESEKYQDAIDYVLTNPHWRLSVQMHKILSIR